MNPVAHVIALHRFLEQWLHGRVDKTRENWAAFNDPLAEDFEMLSPRAVRDTKHAIAEEIWGIHGLWSGTDYGIEIREMVERWRTDEACLVRYEEWHTGKTPPEVRLSSALFTRSEGVWRWLHLHETWIPQSDTSTDE